MQANLIKKTDFDAKVSILNRKITSNKTKHLLVENELEKTEKSWFRLFYSEKPFRWRYCTTLFSISINFNEIREVFTKTDNTVTPSVNYYLKVRLRFAGSVLQQKAVRYSHKKSCKPLCSLGNNQLSPHKQLCNTSKRIIWSC